MKFPKEYEAIIRSIADSLELLPMGKIEKEQIPHSLSGLLRLHLWKLVNWIGYEIIHGKYFEAMRDLRFLFEGSIYSVIIEDAIEGKIFKKYEGLSTIGLKREIISLWEKLIEQNARSRGQKRRKKMIEEALREFFTSGNIKEMSEEEKQNYIQDYIQILSDERLWYSTLKLIGEVIKLLEEELRIKVSQKEEDELIGIWKALCDYTHYSGRFLEEIIEDPDYVWMEKFSAILFKKCFEYYLSTLDLFYSVVLWRWRIAKRIEKITKKYREDFPKSFSLTQAILEALESQDSSEEDNSGNHR